MKTRPNLLLLAALILTPAASQAANPTTGFTYGGTLTDGGKYAVGSYDLRFSLYAGLTDPSQIGPSITNRNLQLTNGIFTVQLDFGPGAITSEPRWLEIAVRTNSTEAFSVLSPRQELTTSPYALYAPNAGSVSWTNIAGTPAQFYGAGAGLGLSGTNFYIVPGGVTNSMLAANSVTADKIAPGQVVKSLNSYKDDVTLIPGNNIALDAFPQAQAIEIAAIEVWKTTGNSGLTAANFLGTLDGQALELRVGNTRALLLQPTASTPNVIAGSADNGTGQAVVGAVIAGGFTNRVIHSYGTIGGGAGNRAGNTNNNPFDGRFATVGGGTYNQATGEAAHVGGGQLNEASGELSNVSGGGYNRATGYAATIGGGGGMDQTLGPVTNFATGYWSVIGGGFGNATTNICTTVAGGGRNQAVAMFSAIGGGSDNVASGDYSTIPGGKGNKAEGANSLAGGWNAYARDPGAFVWADASGADQFASLNSNEFAVRATGGVRFVTSAAGGGATLSPGGGSWANLSDRNAKANFAEVNGREVLDRVAALPIQTWNYKAQDAAIRHLGPTAQDFSAAFRVGEDDRHIDTADADGVALAAIQGLYQVVREKEAELQQKEARISAHEKQIAQLQARLAALEKLIGSRLTP